MKGVNIEVKLWIDYLNSQVEKSAKRAKKCQFQGSSFPPFVTTTSSHTK